MSLTPKDFYFYFSIELFLQMLELYLQILLIIINWFYTIDAVHEFFISNDLGMNASDSII